LYIIYIDIVTILVLIYEQHIANLSLSFHFIPFSINNISSEKC